MSPEGLIVIDGEDFSPTPGQLAKGSHYGVIGFAETILRRCR
jgi:hypothetical protein